VRRTSSSSGPILPPWLDANVRNAVVGALTVMSWSETMPLVTVTGGQREGLTVRSESDRWAAAVQVVSTAPAHSCEFYVGVSLHLRLAGVKA
jgi:hypothetical protein